MARAEYDPVKAHDYYERTKQLKGRKPGSPTPHLQNRKASTAQVQTAEQKVKAIKEKIEKLRALLREKVAAAKSDKPETQNSSQKAAEAKKDAAYYDKNKESIKAKAKATGGGSSSSPAKTADSMSADELRSAISAAVTQLKSAIANAQKLRGG